MRIETSIPGRLDEASAAAARLEALGYDACLSLETEYDPFLPLVQAAAATSTLGLGTGIAVAFPRSPMVIAQMAWELQRFSGGRLRLGLGPQVKGHNERRFSVPWSAPAPRMREYVLALKAIWAGWQSGEPYNFQGKHYQFSLMTPQFAPAPVDDPAIPVDIAAVGPAMCRVAGEVCDGIRLHPLNSPKYIADVVLPNVEIGAARSGRRVSDVQLIHAGFAVVGDTEAEIRAARGAVAQRIAFYGSTRSYRGVLEIHGYGDLSPQLHALSVKGRWGEMTELISDEVLETFAVVGSAEDAARELQRRFAATCGTAAFDVPATLADEERARRALTIARGDA